MSTSLTQALQRLPLALPALLLAACSNPHRVELGWAAHAWPTPVGRLAVAANAQTATAAVQAASQRLGLKPLQADPTAGLLSFTKPDPQFSNCTWVLNVAVSPDPQATGSTIRFRGHIYTDVVNTWARAFPAAKGFESDFEAALTAELGRATAK